MLHVESPLHDTEQASLHRTVHVDPSEQVTLLLSPTTRLHSDMPLQSALHDAPHVPVQVLSFVQSSVQLAPLHPESPMSQAVPAGHAHEVPLHWGAAGSLPHAPNTITKDSR